jgi:hypothetical protein
VSSPTAPAIATAAPSRAAAAAWLAPLPPGSMRRPCDSSVWPGSGNSSSAKIRSALSEPKTMIIRRFWP